MMPISRGLPVALGAAVLSLWLGCSPDETGLTDGGAPAGGDAGSSSSGDAGGAPTDGGAPAGDAGNTQGPEDGGLDAGQDGGDATADGGGGSDLCAGVSCSGLGACVVTDAVVEVDLASRCEDAYISGGADSASNYATSAERLVVYSWPADTTVNRGVMKCDLSDIPTDAVVEEARLQLYQHGFVGNGGDDEYEISARAIVNHDPLVSAVTWESYDGTNAWTGGANGGADDLAPATGAVVVDKTLGFKEWRLDDMVQAWVSDPAANYGFMLDGDATASADTNRAFRPREHGVETERPHLFVRYSLPGTPEASCQCDDGARADGLDCVLDDAGVMDDAGAPMDAGIADDAGAPDSGPVVDPSVDPCESAAGACFYVDQGHAQASDDNPGTRELPWATPYRAAQQALSPGDVVVFRPGLYRIDHGGIWSRPAISPASSGTAEAPITFVAWPRHGAILDGSNPVDGTQALIGSAAKDHVIIDGFIVQNTYAKGILVFGAAANNKAEGVVIRNNIIRGVHHTHPTDNTDGIRLEDASGPVVRNNEIYDVRNGNMTANAAGVKMYRVEGALIEHNEVYDVSCGMIDKQGGINNVLRRNYIHDCLTVGLYSKTSAVHPAHGFRAYENIVDGCSKGALAEQSSADVVLYDIAFYNNVFANYREAGATPMRYSGTVSLWNNIFFRTAAPSVGELYTYNDPPDTVGLLDYNLYVTAPTFVLGRYATNRTFTSLSSWTAETGFDSHSLAAAPLFVDADAGDFRLAAGSPAVGAGRSDGTPAGAVVDMGAYPTGSGVVGRLP